MQLWLIVPVKPLAEGKSRLSPSLSTHERYELSRHLLAQTLAAAADVALLSRVMVISRDVEALDMARAAGMMVFEEEAYARENGDDPEDPLNRALRQARIVAMMQGADAILVLPADLPLISAAEIRSFVQLGEDLAHGLVIAASGDGGTNALLLKPPHAIDFAYGPGSFREHIRRAEDAGLPVEIIESVVLALDLDSPEDLHTWQVTLSKSPRN
ncbi:MAG: 2-phospho-L-lactate guanylyltransferase [Caldilineaceae bacterium]|nr:2-phospho-L-lactate guanylyltransferase [Caldilineaceae bacterium]